MIKNIIFDLGGVVLKNTPSMVMNSIGIDNFDYDIIYNNFFSNLAILDNGNITLDDYYKKCNIPTNLKNKYKEVLCNYYKYREFNDEILNLMKKLKNNNYNIYILSNNNRETYEYLSKLKVLSFVDGWVISSEYGVMKPNVQLYKILLDKYKIHANECYFIDDLEENVITSLNLRMRGFVYNDINLLIQDLNDNNIVVE